MFKCNVTVLYKNYKYNYKIFVMFNDYKGVSNFNT